MSRPTKETKVGGENSKRFGEPRPYMDEQYLMEPTHHLRRASLPRWSCPSFTKDGRAHRGSLVHLY